VRGIEVPERTEDFTADPVELFFDLAYVFAFSQMVGVLAEDPSWATAGRSGVLFLLLWLPWSQFTWSANAVSGNGRPTRLLFLIGTAASVPMAASVTTAFGPGGPVFAITVGVIYVLAVATMTLGLEAGSNVHRSLVRWVVPNAAGLAVLIAGAFVDGSARVALWALTLAIVLSAMFLAGRGEWIVRSGHFAERHGLIVIIALGEVIVAIGVPVVEALESGGLPALTVVALVASGAFAGLLWWGYFDRLSPALEHRGEQVDGDRERGRYVRDVYTWGHAPVVAGVILAAAALEEITLHPGDPAPGSIRLLFFGGLVLVALGAAGTVWRAFRAVARERLVAIVVLGAVLAAAGSWDGVLLVVAVDVVIAATLVVEHVRIER
jgi:low temperature requirement protein LtrA